MLTRRFVIFVVLVAASAGCSAATTVTETPAPVVVTVPPSCSWYSPEAGQQVTVVITGPGCPGTALIGQVAEWTGRDWLSTTQPGAGREIATLAKGRTTVAIWQTGPIARPSQPPPAASLTAGYLADDFEEAGWAPR